MASEGYAYFSIKTVDTLMHPYSDSVKLVPCIRLPLRWFAPHCFSKQYLIALTCLTSLFFGLGWYSTWFGWLLFVSIIPLLLIVQHCIRFGKHASFIDCFVYLFLALFLWNTLTTWWLSQAAFAAFLFVAFFNTCCLLAPWYVYYHMRKQLGMYVGYIALVASWLTLEYAHLAWESWEFTFPWLNLGNGLAGLHGWIQWYCFTGILGGSLWILIVNLLLYHWLAEAGRTYSSCLAFVLLPLGLSSGMYYTHTENGTLVEVVVVQPNFDSYTEKAHGSPHFVPVSTQIERLLDLTHRHLTPNTSLVVWPESAIDCCLEEDCILQYQVMQPIIRFLEAHPNISLISGISTFQKYGTIKCTKTAKKRGKNYVDYFNSVLHMRKSPHLNLDIYHKIKRLPGGEYIPYFHLLPTKVLAWIKKQIADIGEIDPCLAQGNETKVFVTEHGVQIAPINCYESLYGAFVGSACQKGARLLTVLTNDGWWGNTPIYQHHFKYSQLLAVSHRRSLIRAANTGISGCINQRGDVLTATNRLESAAVRQFVCTNDRSTFYSIYGDYIGQIAFCVFLFLLCVLLTSSNPKPLGVKQ